jgi:hypothetical protein
MQTANLVVMIILSGLSGVKPVAFHGFLTIDECKKAIPTVVENQGFSKAGTEIFCVPSSFIEKDTLAR